MSTTVNTPVSKSDVDPNFERQPRALKNHAKETGDAL